MAQSAPVRQSRSHETSLSDDRGILGGIECPKCHSDDVTRSRRRLRERVVLAVTRAAVYRCRDCKNRFLVGAQWRFVILALLSVVVAATFVVSMQLVRRSRQEAAAQADAPKPVRGYRPLRTPLPRGLPPLSSVPRPAVNPKKP